MNKSAHSSSMQILLRGAAGKLELTTTSGVASSASTSSSASSTKFCIRSFSSSSSAETTSRASSAVAVSSSSTASRVMSRRVWGAHHVRHRPSQTTSSKSSATASDDDKPWPKSVVYARYVAAVTLIPYFTMWIVSASPTLREMFFGMEEEEDRQPNDNGWKVVDRIRRHFGEVDPDAVSYVDLIENQQEEQYRLPLELPAAVRARQAAIRQRNNEPVVVTMSVENGETNNNVVKMTLPGSTRANRETLYHLLKNNKTQAEPFVRSSAAGVDQDKGVVPSIAVHFASPPAATTTTSDPNQGVVDDSTTVFSAVDSNNSTTAADATIAQPFESTSRTSRDPLLQKVQTYSSWQYQDPELVPATASGQEQKGGSNKAAAARGGSNAQPYYSADDIEKSRLEYEIAQLEDELHAGSSRSVDDILLELNERKAKLRKFTWKKWIPW